jgi:hypothetical protein
VRHFRPDCADSVASLLFSEWGDGVTTFVVILVIVKVEGEWKMANALTVHVILALTAMS